MTLFKIPEFINMAVMDEETGEAFYRAVAETTKDDKVKSEFLRIADQEKYHAEAFRKLLAEAGSFEKREEYPGQYGKYLNNLCETRAFPDPKKAVEMAKDLKNDREAVELALKLEKDTLLFYFEIMQFIPETHRKEIDRIIDEERTHISDLAVLSNMVG